MCTASPKMSSLPILALLLLLAHCTPLAQGSPLPTTYITLLNEMGDLLSQSPVPPKDKVDIHHKIILQNKTFLRTNLEEFLDAAKNFEKKTERITKILTEFRTVVPTAPSTEYSVSVDGDWDDFRRMLKEYLYSLKQFVIAKISSPTTRSHSGPS